MHGVYRENVETNLDAANTSVRATMTAVFTIISKNYLAFARTLMASVREHHPDVARFVILADRIDAGFRTEDFTVIGSDALSIEQSRWFHFKYTLLELSTAIKPYAIEYLTGIHQIDRLFYIDPDIRLYSPITGLEQALDSADIVLTPHLLAPMNDDGKLPGELEVMRSGVFNLGFLGLRMNARTAAFVKWWQSKLYDHCYVDHDKGLFTDQKWIDLVPGAFPSVHIERNPRYNVAYWNIAQREVRSSPGGYIVNGEPLGFFHFSGLDPLHPQSFSKLQNRFTLDDVGDTRQLVLDYAREVAERGHDEYCRRPYTYGAFYNDVPILDMCRRYARGCTELMQSIPDPFSEAGFRAYQDYWNSPAERVPGGGITRLVHKIYTERLDLQRVMPDIAGADRLQLLEWVLRVGKSEYGLPDSSLTPIKSLLFSHRSAASQRQRAETDRQNRSQIMVAQIIRAQWKALPARLAELLGPVVSQLSTRVLDGTTLTGWLCETVNYHGVALPRIAVFVLEGREDLKQHFPEAFEGDPSRFLAWLVTYGRSEYQLRGDLLESVQSAARGAIARKPASIRLSLWKYSAQLKARELLKTAPPDVSSARASSVPLTLAMDMSAQAMPQKLRVSGAGLNIVGYLRSEMGVGEAGRCAALAASRAGIAVSLNNFEVGVLSRTSDARAGAIDNRFLYDINVFNVNADQTGVLTANTPSRVFRGKYNIGYWVWELQEFPDSYTSAFAPFHEIWAPSRFCQDAISRKSPLPVVRIPYAIDVDPPDGASRISLGLPQESFLFLTMFDVLSVVARKNPLGVIAAFRSLGSDVLANSKLVIKINNGTRNTAAVEDISSACTDLPVVIIDRIMTRAEVNSLIACCDCLVSLHRSEGFGLSLAEAMYLGKPVVATAYSGNMDFTAHDNSLLVSYRLVPVGPGAEPYPATGVWAEPDLAEARQHMLQVYANPELRAVVANRGKQYVRENFAPVVVGAMMKSRIQEIAARSRRASAGGAVLGETK